MEEAKRVSIVYILQAGSRNEFKIGTTTVSNTAELRRRPADLQTGNASTLHYFNVTTGSYHAEKWLQKYFRAKGVKINRRGSSGWRGEWFRYHPDMNKINEIIPLEIKLAEGPARSDDPHRICPCCRKSFRITGNHHKYCSEECETKHSMESIKRIALENFRELIEETN